MTFNSDSPLNRIPGESRKANQALRDYAMMGVGRSIRDLFERYSKPGVSGAQAELPPTSKISTLWGWSSNNHWVDRVARFDELEQEARLVERERRRQQLEDSDWATGDRLRQRVTEFLELLPKFLKTSETVMVDEVSDPVHPGQKIKRETRVIMTALNTNLGQLASALKAATELQRLATDSPTQRTEHTGKDGEPFTLKVVYENARAKDTPETAPPGSG